MHIVSPHWLPFTGGAELVAAEIARGLSVEHRVTVHTSTETPGGVLPAGRATQDGMTVIRYRTRPRRPVFLPDLGGADLVHMHGFYRPLVLATALQVRRRPLIVQPHGGAFAPSVPSGAGLRPLARELFDMRLLRLLGRRLSAFVCSSNDEVERLQSIGLGRVPSVLLPGPLRRDLFEEAEKLSTEKQVGLFVLIARLVPLKCVEHAIQALAYATGSRLVIIGAAEDPVYAARLRTLSIDLEVAARVEFAGPLATGEVARMLASAVGCIATSRKEGWGLTVAEALLFRAVPIVPIGMSSGHDRLSESLGVPLRYEWGDARQLAELMTRTAASPQGASEPVERGREWVMTTLTPAAVTRQVAELYESVRSANA